MTEASLVIRLADTSAAPQKIKPNTQLYGCLVSMAEAVDDKLLDGSEVVLEPLQRLLIVVLRQEVQTHFNVDPLVQHLFADHPAKGNVAKALLRQNTKLDWRQIRAVAAVHEGNDLSRLLSLHQVLSD